MRRSARARPTHPAIAALCPVLRLHADAAGAPPTPVAQGPLRSAHPPLPSSPTAPAAQALGRVLSLADEPYRGKPSYYSWLCDMYADKRATLAAGLEAAGMRPLQGEGGFFLMADTSAIEVPQRFLQHTTPAAPLMTRDWALCRMLALEAGVIAIPCSPFYSAANKKRGEHLVRFAFCKSDETLRAASARLEGFVAASRGR